MTRKIIAAAAVAVLLVFATSSDAKPLKVAGGCTSTESIPAPGSPPYQIYYQSFKPTFSLLKTVSLALWGDSETIPLASDVTFELTLRTSIPGDLGFSYGPVTAVLPAGSTKVDAESGFTVMFTFVDGVQVTPGAVYTIELRQVDNVSTVTHACFIFESYADGAFYWGLTEQGTRDFEFKVTGSGSGRAR